MWWEKKLCQYQYVLQHIATCKPHRRCPGLQNSCNLPKIPWFCSNPERRRFPAYSLLIPGIFHPGVLGNLGILGKFQEFCNPRGALPQALQIQCPVSPGPVGAMLVRVHSSPQNDLPKVGAHPLAVLWFPRVRTGVGRLLDAPLIHWTGEIRAEHYDIYRRAVGAGQRKRTRLSCWPCASVLTQ